MGTSVQKPTVFNPTNGRKKKKNGLGYLAALGFTNPERKGTNSMAKPKSKKPKATANNKPKPKQKNSSMPGYLATPKKKKRNGSITENMKPVQVVKDGATVLAGVLISRQAPQFALREKNEGALGYASNFGVALLGGGILGYFFGARTGFNFAAGGAAYTISRIATEKLSPVGKFFSLAGVGDASAASLGDVKRAGVGIVVDSSYNYPQLTTPNGRVLIPTATRQYVAQQIGDNNAAMAARVASAASSAAALGRYRRAA